MNDSHSGRLHKNTPEYSIITPLCSFLDRDTIDHIHGFASAFKEKIFYSIIYYFYSGTLRQENQVKIFCIKMSTELNIAFK